LQNVFNPFTKTLIKMKIIKKFKSIESFETERLLAIKLTASALNEFSIMHTNLIVMETLGP